MKKPVNVSDAQDRRRVTTPREDRIIVRHARAEPFTNANVIASRIQNRRQQPVRQISAQTIRNRLRDAHLRSYRSLQVPMLNRYHRRARLTYAHRHVRWIQRQWSNVLFTDESRFSLYGNDRRQQVWRRRGERYRQNCNRPIIEFYGGSVMVWAGISRNSRTPLVVIPPPGLTARRYINEILRPYICPIRDQTRNRFILMHNNARPHTANIT